MLTLAMPYDESDSAVEAAIEHLRDDLVPPAFDGVDAEHAVGGGAARVPRLRRTGSATASRS